MVQTCNCATATECLSVLAVLVLVARLVMDVTLINAKVAPVTMVFPRPLLATAVQTVIQDAMVIAVTSAA